MKSRAPQTNDVLERNVSTLLESGGEPPRISDAARARIRAQLVATHGTNPARARSPLAAVTLGLAATVAGALIVTRVVGGGDGGSGSEVEPSAGNGATWIAHPGSTITELGPRRLRVEGAALIDVEPGKGIYTVETARGTIEVIGTRFVVDADAKRTTAAVVRGAVKLASSDGSVVLHAGEQAVAEPGRPPTRGPAPRLSHLVSWAAQVRREQDHDSRPVRNGTLFARDPNRPWIAESPLPIAKLGVDIVVEDQVARVAIDQTFHNPASTVMEGMYRFAIPPDAALQRMAMYVDGKLTEAAVVERMAARRIYEEVVYRQVDPALLEWAGTGRLSLKVYPLPAEDDKRLLIAYTQSLPKLYDDWSITVPLPEVDLPVGELAFDVTLKGCGNCEVTSPSHQLAVKHVGEDATATVRQRAARIGDSLVLHVRDTRTAATAVRAQSAAGRFVMVRATPELPRSARDYRRRTWVILDDVSASRDATARRAQHDVIDGLLRELDEEDRVAVVAFDVAARTKLAPTRVLDVDRSALRKALEREPGIGATDFGGALDAATQLLADTPAANAMVVYLGDGVVSAGPRQLDALRAKLVGKAQFIGVGIGDGPDVQTLGALASASGGYATTIDLADDVRWRAFDLVAALHTARVTGVTARLVDSGGALVPATVYVNDQAADGEQLEVVAKLASDGVPAFAEVSGMVDGKPWSQRVALAASSSDTNAGYLPRLWAQRHVAARLLAKHEPVAPPVCAAAVAVANPRTVRQPTAPVCKTLAQAREERDEAIRKEVVALGKQFFLLSRHTSLLVLENDAMYKQYGVEKGSGETWAPYVVPAKIPVAVAAVPVDGVLVRPPLQVFWGGSAGLYKTKSSEFRMVRAGLDKWHDARTFDSDDTTAADQQPQLPLTVAVPRELQRDDVGDLESAEQPSDIPFSGHSSLENTFIVEGINTATFDPNFELAEGKMGNKAAKGYFAGAPRRPSYPARLASPLDSAYDDVTAFVPGLQLHALDSWRVTLERAGAGATRRGPQLAASIDDGARRLLAASRAALPVGEYRWNELTVIVDQARRLGWRQTLGNDLVESSSFDGTTVINRYNELGLATTRKLADASPAVAFAIFPLWIAEPDHYARWFDVRLTGPKQITLSRTISKGKTAPAYILEFDPRDHLVAVLDSDRKPLLTVTWDGDKPTQARLAGEPVKLGFTQVMTADAIAWAGDATTQVAIELPMHVPAHWEREVAAQPVGSAPWRRAHRQWMASLAAAGDRARLLASFEALRAHGSIELGDLALASGAVVSATTDAQARAAFAVPAVAGSPLVAYLAASRAYTQQGKSDRLAVTRSDGFVGALWSLREITALLVAGKPDVVPGRLAKLGNRAFDFRWTAAAMTLGHPRMKADDVARVWESVAVGEFTNIARARAAEAMYGRGDYNAAAERWVRAIEDLDVTAEPFDFGTAYTALRYSRRGEAGWQLLRMRWEERVLGAASYDHVMALLTGLAYTGSRTPGDNYRLLAHAGQLAGNDTDRMLAVARLAQQANNSPLAEQLLASSLKVQPTRGAHLTLAQLARARGQLGDALAHLEAAQQLGSGEAVTLTTLRQEFATILDLIQLIASQQLATRNDVIQRGVEWGNRWRAIDPANPEIDRRLGELMLAVGNTTEAWRYLSSIIDRDPMSGQSYMTIAEQFERRGKLAEALEYWQQAIVLDQTNPTPRLRKANALFALGRNDDGNQLIEDILHRSWHQQWAGVVSQARSLVRRGEPATGGFDE